MRCIRGRDHGNRQALRIVAADITVPMHDIDIQVDFAVEWITVGTRPDQRRDVREGGHALPSVLVQLVMVMV